MIVSDANPVECVSDLEATDLAWLAHELGLDDDPAQAGITQLRERMVKALSDLARNVAALQVPTMRAILIGYAPQATAAVVPSVASPKPRSISRTAIALQPEFNSVLAYGHRLRRAYERAERGFMRLQTSAIPDRVFVERALQVACSIYTTGADDPPPVVVPVRLSQAVAFAGRYQIALSYALPVLALWLETEAGSPRPSDVEQVIQYLTLRARLWARLAEHSLLNEESESDKEKLHVAFSS